MHRLTATDTPMVRYTRTIFPSYAEKVHEIDSGAYIIMSEVADIFSNNMDKV